MGMHAFPRWQPTQSAPLLREESLRRRQERLQQKHAVAEQRQAAVAAQEQTARKQRDQEALQRTAHARTAAVRSEQEYGRRHDLFQACTGWP